jgi:hypothetical protein
VAEVEEQQGASALAKYKTREFAAYLLMLLFVTCSTVGAFLIFPPAGFITLGVTSGIYAYLLGSD